MTPLTEDELARPLTAEEEARWRAYIEAAIREGVHVKGGLFDMSARLFATLAALRATPVADTAGIDAAREVVARIPATAERLQYVNPNVREDAYNKGVRDLAEAIAAALRTPKPEGERP